MPPKSNKQQPARKPRGKGNRRPINQRQPRRQPRNQPTTQQRRTRPPNHRNGRNRVTPPNAHANSAAVAYRPKQRHHRKMMMSHDGRSLRVVACEPIVNLATTNAFAMPFDEYINPANPAIFPVLCKEAVLYDKWRLKSLRLIYEPKCPTNTVGQLGLSVIPDVESSEAPTSMIQLEYYAHSVTSAAWCEATTSTFHGLDAETWYFVAPPSEFSDTVTLGTKRTQSNGVIQMFTAGGSLPENNLLGTVYVEYDIEFIERRPPMTASLTYEVPTFRPPGGSGNNQIFNIADPSRIHSTIGDTTADFLSRSSALLTALGISTAAYQANVIGGSLLAINRFFKMSSGFTRIIAATTFGAYGFVGSYANNHSVEEIKEFAMVDSPPKLVRAQTKAKLDAKEVPPAVSFYEVLFLKTGIMVRYFPGGPLEPYPVEVNANFAKRISAPTTLYDCAFAVITFRPLDNSTNVVYSSPVTNLITANTILSSINIQTNYDDPLFALCWAATDVGVGSSSRNVDTTYTLFHDSRRPVT